MGMNEVLAAQKNTNIRLEELGEKVEWLDETIRGNGKPGINQRLVLIELHLARIDFWVGILAKVALPVLVTLLVMGVGAYVKSVV